MPAPRGRFSGNGALAQRPPAGEDAVERPFEARTTSWRTPPSDYAAVDGADQNDDDYNYRRRAAFRGKADPTRSSSQMVARG
jgi:hypothetical protein